MFTLNCRGRLLAAEQPLVMGIMNITPDSFYEGSRQQELDAVLKKAEQMLQDGAAILDIGGQSTRPGADIITAEDESRRVVDPIRAICTRFPEAIISIDTFYASVARDAVAAGASIINDISGGHFDAAMLATAASLHTPYICMHMKGTPQTMNALAVYDDLITELLDYFIERIDACKRAGITDIIIDPGFGFAKKTIHNFTLLQQLKVFQILGKPVLAGLSRKASIYKTLAVSADEALNGTTVLNTMALLNGAAILRVHDVKEAVEAVRLVNAVIC